MQLKAKNMMCWSIVLLLMLGMLEGRAWGENPGSANHDDGQAPATQEEKTVEETKNKTPPSVENNPPETVVEEKLISVAFRDMKMEQLAQFFMRELGKPVILDDGIKNTSITILAQDKMPIGEAFELIKTALRKKGVIMLEGPKRIEFLPIEQVKRINRRVVKSDESVSDVEDPTEIVDKVFEVEHFDVTRLKDLIMPLLPDYAFVMADPNVKRLVVTDAAVNLSRIEAMVARLDVPRAGQTIERIFHIERGDASEIVSMVRIIIAGTLGGDAKAVFSGGGGNKSGGARGGGRGDGGANVIFVERSDVPILLHADVGRNWILAVAAPSVMEQVERWIKELDKPRQQDEPYAIFDVKHADISELAAQITQVIEAMPDQEVKTSVRVIPFLKSRQLLVYGSQRGRNLVTTLMTKLDVESSQYQMVKEISLQYDSAENVKTKIEELFSEASGSNNYNPWGGYNRRRGNQEERVKVTADSQRNSVTVMTDPVRMARIEALIAEQWDKPVDLGEVAPKVYTLKYTDPVQVKTLLENMFTKSSTRTSGSWWSGNVTTESLNPVGRLFGQFSFEALRGSDTLLVSTKSTANYEVIDKLIAQIDQPQVAGLPLVIELKHANAEDVAEQLNAMFSEPGTSASIIRTARGLSDRFRTASSVASGNNSGNQNNNQNNNRDGNNQDAPANAMTFWWARSRPTADEQPTSNLIGKPRFVPVNRRNALMVMAPRAYYEPMEKLINELDKPGSQVVINAIITEVQHDDETTLGIRFASDPSILADTRLGDQAIGGSGSVDFSQMFSSGRGVVNAGIDLNFLLQLLVRKIDLKILNEPRVYTSDNQEAHFFDGQDVPVVIGDITPGDNASNVTRSFDYRSVGTRLHVRPHITQEGDIDLEVNLELSRIEGGENVFGNFIFNRRETTTHVTLKDGQTVIISGIVRKEDFKDIRKFPILGDLPLIGGLFRNTDKGVRNREVIAFITPRIVNHASDDAIDLSESNRQWLDRIRGTMTEIKAKEGEGEALQKPSDAVDSED